MKALFFREWFLLKKVGIIYTVVAAVIMVCHALPIFNGDSHFLYAINSLTCMIFCYCHFSVDPKCFLASAIAPVKRSDIVNVKYIFLIATLLCGVVLSVICSFIGVCFLGTDIEIFLKYELLFMASVALCTFLIYPFVFRFGASASILMPLSVGFITGFFAGITELDVFSDNWLPEMSIIAAVCVLALLISYVVSLCLYKRRNIK